VELRRPASLKAFREEALPLLLEHEIEHGLIFSITNVPNPPADAYCALVVHDGEVVAAALRTIKKAALSLEKRPGAIALIAADALRDPKLQGVLGPRASVEAFAAASGRQWKKGMAQGLYECLEVVPPAKVGGARRVTTPSDRTLLATWIRDFLREAGGENATMDEATAAADRHIASGKTYFWIVDGEPVSYAGAYNFTPNGVRVGPVYTPAEYRRRGYAAALVAEVTQQELNDGRSFAYLYTNLENPTSNALYQRIGYRRVGEAIDSWII
jgi:predicted GNAT family acetyltransferase